MLPVRFATATRAAISSFYKKATYCYATPFVLLVLGFIVPFLAPLSIIILLPLGVVGLFFTKRGLALAIKTGDREKKDVGYANLILGIIILILGLFGLAVIYMMVN